MNNNQTSSIPLLGISIWLLAVIFFLYEFFLRTFLGSIANQFIPDLHLNAETFAIIGSIYYVSYGLMQVPIGALTDKFGIKIILIISALICGFASILIAHATGFYTACLARIIMGLGSSSAFVCLLVVVSTWFPERYFGTIAGVSQFFGTMGPLLAAGPLIALIHYYHQTWRHGLIFIGYIGLVLSVCFLLVVKQKPRDTNNFVMLNIPKSFRKNFTLLFKNKQAWCIALYSACVYVPIAFLGAIWGTDYLQTKGLTQNQAATVVSFAWLGYAIGCPLLGLLSDLSHRRKTILMISAVTGLISTLLMIFITFYAAESYYILLFILLGLAAAGQNIGFAAIAEQVQRDLKASALGFNNALITLSSAIIPPIASFFILLSHHSTNNNLTASDFTLGFLSMPLLYFIAMCLVMFAIKETFCKHQKAFIILNSSFSN